MAQDPIYLRHLGVLATLRNFLGSRYYQTVWEDFSSDEEVWNDYAKRTDPQTIHRLVEQIETLLKQPPEAIDQFLADALGASGGLYFANPQEAAAWLQRFRTHMLLVLSQKQSFSGKMGSE
jgi:CdiI immunity protein